MSFISIRYNVYLFIVEFVVSLASLAFVLIMNLKFRKYVRGLIKGAVERTADVDKVYLENFDFPIVIVGPHNDIIWTNSSFTNVLSKGKDPIGYKIDTYIGTRRLRDFISKSRLNLN